MILAHKKLKLLICYIKSEINYMGDIMDFQQSKTFKIFSVPTKENYLSAPYIVFMQIEQNLTDILKFQTFLM